jgi:hypothetical protein
VTGKHVVRVTYDLGSRRLATVSRADSRGRFVTTVNPRGLRKRTSHRLTAKVTTTSGQRVLHREFTLCG